MATLTRMVPPLPQTDRGAFCILNADSTGERLLYCNGNNVLWRSLEPLAQGDGSEKPEDVFVWKGHAKRTTCASMSPNGQWVVSGDVTGALRLWGAKGDHIQKNEYKLWDGVVKDVSFSGDSGRIVAAGDGKEVRACALIWDTGSKTGDVSGHSKTINSISFRSQRPFRVITGGEDMLVACHEGPPFKFKQSHSNHSNFVNCVRYSPDGDWAVSAGSDAKLCLFDGKTGDLVKEFAKPDGIALSIWAVEWSPDSKHLATAGGDKTVRIWNRETAAQVCVAKVGKQVLEDQQVGLSWVSPRTVVTVCLDGRLLVWRIEDDFSAVLASTVDGTQGALTCLALDAKSGTLLQGGGDGFIALTPAAGPVLKTKIGKGVQHIVAHSKLYKGDAEAWVISLDNCVRRVSPASGEIVGSAVEVKEFAVGAGWLDAEETKLLVVSSKNNLHCVSSSAVDWSKTGAVERQPTAAATLPGKMVAIAMDKPDGTVGGVASQEYNIQLFNLAGSSSDADISAGKLLEGHMGEVCAMQFSPCGKFLISADAKNKIFVWDVAEGVKVSSDFSRHTARVTTLSWIDSKHFVSGSLDQNVTVHDLESKSVTAAKVADLAQAHRGGVAAVVGCGDNSFASVGMDGFLLIHKLK